MSWHRPQEIVEKLGTNKIDLEILLKDESAYMERIVGRKPSNHTLSLYSVRHGFIWSGNKRMSTLHYALPKIARALESDVYAIVGGATKKGKPTLHSFEKLRKIFPTSGIAYKFTK